ncbi:uncharacterized protein LOC122246161 [Penaeus japonicus]|uniref:uncharacterized protein LOC122246161 n=1 Tax=Penaeus japonicus TaxID=27405 RepID=UPI001C71192C|nr:uncharacterized protein LOC122246161 [Penaeus japonicus]
MAAPRPQHLLCLIFGTLVVTAAFACAPTSASARFSPRSPFLFRARGKEGQELAARGELSKRTRENFTADLVQFFSEEQVQEATKIQYKSIPEPVIYTSQVLQQGVSCSTLHSEMHENYIKPELRLRPEWIYESKLIGDCPTHYVTRELPSIYSPSTVLEAVCACRGSQCSKDGHQCVPVSRHVPVWVRRGPNLHVLDVEELTVACACAQRPSAGGNFIYSAAVES